MLTGTFLGRFIRRRYASVIFEITPRCNLACRHCFNVWKNDAPYPTGELPTGAVLDLLGRVLDETGTRTVALSGGEPLLRPDIVEVIRFLAKRRAHITLLTNGLLLDEERAARLVAAGVGCFEIPLLSHRKEVHDALARGEAQERALAAIGNVRAAGGRVVVVFVATAENLSDLPETLELSVGMGVDGFLLNRFNPGGEGAKHRADLLPDPKALAAGLAAADGIARRYGIPVASSVPIPPCVLDTSRFEHLTFATCPLGTRQAYFTVDPVGNLRACNHSPTVLGSLFESGFRELAEGRLAREYSRALPAACSSCEQLSGCGGGCRAAAEACFGSPRLDEPLVERFRDRSRPCGTCTSS